MAEFIVDDRILKAAGSSATYTTSVEESEYFVEESLAREDDKLYRIHSYNVLCYSCVIPRQLVPNTIPSVIRTTANIFPPGVASWSTSVSLKFS